MSSGPKICLLLVLGILLWFLWDSCGSLNENLENLKDLTSNFPGTSVFTAQGGPNLDAASAPQGSMTVPSDENLEQYFQNPSRDLGVPDQTAFFQNVPSASERDEFGAINAFSKQMETDIKKDGFDAREFLPQEIHEDWFQTDLSNSKVVDQAALIDVSRFTNGVDTVGQSLKNASHDIRGNIPNPKIVVSPFLQSSYDPDTNIKSWW
jgi:hypothetical protein